MRYRKSKITVITLISCVVFLVDLSSLQEGNILLHPNTLRKISSNFKSKFHYPGKLQYVALGTSVTWGQGLEDRETETYIKLLSPHATNLGMRASDASYASLCTQSLLGMNRTYDVIIVEYERRYEEGLDLLVHRLRQRFPDALIILTDIWTFMNVYVIKKSDKNKIVPFVDWLRQNGIMKNEKQAYDFVAGASSSAEAVNFVFAKMLNNRSEYLSTLAKKYRLQIFSWEKTYDEFKVHDILLKYLPLYHRDFIHLSKRGHEHAAEQMRNMVTAEGKRRLFYGRLPAITSASGSWGDGDFCSFWVENGIMPKTYGQPKLSLTYDTKIIMKKFDTIKHKYALQFPFSSSKPQENVFEVQIINPFDQSRVLSLVYMATGPNTTIYPKTKFTILPADSPTLITNQGEEVLSLRPPSVSNNKRIVLTKEKDNQNLKSKIIHPIVNSYNYPVHVQLTTSIGTVTPGTNTIQIEPLEASNAPFRLVGFAITNNIFTLSKMFERASPLIDQQEKEEN